MTLFHSQAQCHMIRVRNHCIYIFDHEYVLERKPIRSEQLEYKTMTFYLIYSFINIYRKLRTSVLEKKLPMSVMVLLEQAKLKNNATYPNIV